MAVHHDVNVVAYRFAHRGDACLRGFYRLQAFDGHRARHSHALELFDLMCATLPPERIWDICYLIAHTQKQAYRKGRHELTALFLQGRLKRKRRNQKYCLQILPENAAKGSFLSQR